MPQWSGATRHLERSQIRAAERASHGCASMIQRARRKNVSRRHQTRMESVSKIRMILVAETARKAFALQRTKSVRKWLIASSTWSATCQTGRSTAIRTKQKQPGAVPTGVDFLFQSESIHASARTTCTRLVVLACRKGIQTATHNRPIQQVYFGCRHIRR